MLWYMGVEPRACRTPHLLPSLPLFTHYYAVPMVTGKSWELVDAVAGRKPARRPFVVLFDWLIRLVRDLGRL